MTWNIRIAWKAVFGEDITSFRTSGPEQYRGLCPFHNDHTPSCDVSLTKNAFVCRVCNAHGGVLDLVIEAGYATTRAGAAAWLREREC